VGHPVGLDKNDPMIDPRTETVGAATAIREALEIARLGTGGVHAKVGRDVVTDTDIAVEDHLRRALTSAFEWPVIGEERGGTVPVDTPYWLVDPICGTRNFASAIPLYAVNAAMVENGRVTIAVVGDGSTGDILVAEFGNGAWRLGQGQPTALSTTPSSLILDFGANPKAGPDRDRAALAMAEAIRRDRWDVRCLSTTLSLAYVAAGKIAGCVLFDAPDCVHTAAGTLLVAEAGGRVTDTAGGPWTLLASSLVCSAEETFHQEVLDLIAPRNRL
jgi:myo-inositol-1(or 4)-monophosphatase